MQNTAISPRTPQCGFLGNAYPCNLTYNGFDYKNAEHAYQASKCPPGVANDVRKAPTVVIAHQMASRVAPVSDWDDLKVQVMRDILAVKFGIGSRLAAMLYETYPARILNTNSWFGDLFWGLDDGMGENWLGLLLMERRNYLRMYAGFDRSTLMWPRVPNAMIYDDAALIEFCTARGVEFVSGIRISSGALWSLEVKVLT